VRSFNHPQAGDPPAVDSAAKSRLGSSWNRAVPHYLESAHQGPAELVNADKFPPSHPTAATNVIILWVMNATSALHTCYEEQGEK